MQVLCFLNFFSIICNVFILKGILQCFVCIFCSEVEEGSYQRWPVLVGTTSSSLHHFPIDGFGRVLVPFIFKNGTQFWFHFFNYGVGSGADSLFSFQIRPVRVFGSITFGFG
jgi:hypothetical protein